MLEDFLTDELTLAVAIGREPNPLGCPQRFTNGFEPRGLVAALCRAGAVKPFRPEKDRRPAFPFRNNVLRLEQVEQMALGREDVAIARNNGGADVYRPAGLLR